MQRYIIANNKNSYVEDFQIRDNLIETLKKRFATYGYRQVRTQTFESYDMYSTITGTVPKDEMIKVIDTTGNVLVLRPDVTIPITRMTALNGQDFEMNQRLFYVLDVFRRSGEQDNEKESTQAGVELFGENSPEIDAEIITLAIHTLNDLGFANFKIEIGHAGFFKEIIQQANLSDESLESLQMLIQSKNLVEIDPFLTELDIDEQLKTALKSIPLLYGEPNTVIKQASEVTSNNKMEEILHKLNDVLSLLNDYGIEDHVVFNLGLINNMNYYSGIIFQGFIDTVGKPVLMGGRYDHLGEQFDSSMPAIGFAFEVDLVVHALQQQDLINTQDPSADILVCYDKEKQRDALKLAYQLRNKDYQVLTYRLDTDRLKTITAKSEIVFNNEKNELIKGNSKQPFTELDEVIELLQVEKEGK